MCKEAFQACVTYLDENLAEAQKRGRLSKQEAASTKNRLQDAQKLLDRNVFDVNKVEGIVNEIKDRLFEVLMDGNLDVKTGDITKQKTDAIVNAANTRLRLGGGVAGAIRKKGGPKIQVACDKITNNGMSPLEMGKVASTEGGNMQPVIHAAVMEWGGKANFESVRRATRNTIIEAAAKGYTTLAIPVMGCGSGGMTPEESARAMKKGLFDRVMDLAKFTQIKIVTSDPQIQAVVEEVFQTGQKQNVMMAA